MVNRLPGNPCAWSWKTTPRIYQALGIKGAKFPKGMHGEYRVDGWQIVVKRNPRVKGGGGVPRIFVRTEGRLVDIGRVRQALCRRDVHHARQKAKRLRGPKGRFAWRMPTR